MLQYSHRGLSKQSYNSLTPENPIVNGKLVPNIRNGTLKTEYPSPETILPREVTPGRCHRAPTIERTKGKKTLCWSNKAAGQEPVWCMAKPRKPEREKTDPVKKPLNCCNSSAACRVSENTA